MGHWIIDTAGIGSLIVVAVAVGVFGAYVRMLRWIWAAPHDQGPKAGMREDRE